MNKLVKVLNEVGLSTHRRFRLTIRAFALGLGLLATFKVSSSFVDGKGSIWWYMLLCFSAIIEFIFADVLAERSFPFDTERKLALLEKGNGKNAIKKITSRLKTLIEGLNACDVTQVSATVHVFVELASTSDQRVRMGLMQLTDYVGPAKGPKGRIVMITQGVVGRCARTGNMEVVDFADQIDYTNAMISEFGFTKKEAKSHSQYARSYLAYPLERDEEIVGVIYLFSPEPQIFPHSVERVSLQNAATEFVNYLDLIKAF